VDKEKRSKESVEGKDTEKSCARKAQVGIRIRCETAMWRETTDEFQ
jgi:hypothetical protein